MITTLTDPHRVTSRKKHRCDWCGKLIVPGEQYTDSVIVDGGIYNWRECDRCAPYVKPMMQWADKNSWRLSSEGYGYEDMAEYMMDAHRDVWKEWWEADHA